MFHFSGYRAEHLILDLTFNSSNAIFAQVHLVYRRRSMRFKDLQEGDFFIALPIHETRIPTPVAVLKRVEAVNGFNTISPNGRLHKFSEDAEVIKVLL